MKKSFLFSIIVSLFILQDVFSISNLKFSHLTIHDGLPHNQVLAISQDYLGFIWIGTRRGLCRYDAYDLRTYLKTSDTASLGNNFIHHIFEDKSKRLWISTDKGVSQYVRSNDFFVNYALNNDGFFPWVRMIFESTGGKIYACTSKGMFRFDENKKEFKLIYLRNKQITNRLFTSAIEDFNGNLWFSTEWGIVCYNEKKNEVVDLFLHKKSLQKLQYMNVKVLFVDKHQRIWIGTSNEGVVVYNLRTGELTRLSEKPGFEKRAIRTIVDDKNQNVWVGGEMGLSVYDVNLQLINTAYRDILDQSQITDNAIHDMFCDSHNNVWIGTYFGGINIFFREVENFKTYSFGYSNKHISGKAVRQIIANDRSSYWIATEDGGLNLFHHNEEYFEHFSNEKSKIPVNTYNIHSLYKDNAGNLWIGTFGAGLNVYNLNNGHMKYYKKENCSISSNMIYAIVPNDNDDLWIGTLAGLDIFSGSSGTFSKTTNTELANAAIYCLLKDSHGDIWIGTQRFGLSKYNQENGSFRKVDLGFELQNFITTIFEDNKGYIWVGTNDGGAVKLNKDCKVLNYYSEKDRLPSSAIMSITQDNNSNIWLCTNNGLVSLSAETNEIYTYSRSDGLPVNQFNYNSAFKSSTGELFFGSIDGLVTLNPAVGRIVSAPLKVSLIDIRIGGETITPEYNSSSKVSITETNSITLSHKEARSLSLYFSTFSYSHAQNIYYAIRMENSEDDNWIQIEKQHNIHFSNLNPGNYQLQIKASYDGIHWSESGIYSLNITVRPPFWLSKIAYVIYIIIFIVIVYFIYRAIRSRIDYKNEILAEKNAKKQLEELNDLKIGFFSNISHELKTPLTLIISPLKQLIQRENIPQDIKNKIEYVEHNSSKLLTLIEDLIEFSKTEIGVKNIYVTQMNICEILSETVNGFEDLASDKKIVFSKTIGIDPRKEIWVSVYCLEKIIHNLLSNAIKFTYPGGKVEFIAGLIVKNSLEYLRFSVVDSGIGISQEELNKIFDYYYQAKENDHVKGSGIGLAITKNLIDLHRGNITVESKAGAGSVFTVEICVDEKGFDEAEKKNENYELAKVPYIDLFVENSINHEFLQPEETDFAITQKPELLIIDDNVELNNFLCGLFEEKYNVHKAYDGKEGLDKSLRLSPDLIISDVMMPLMDGYELCLKLKSDITTSHIPIVLLTAKTSQKDKVSGYNVRADVYIEKPFDPNLLILQVHNLIQTRLDNIKRFKEGEQLDISQFTGSKRDKDFVDQLLKFINENFCKEDLSIVQIADNLNVSSSLFYLKVKKLTGYSPVQLIRTYRIRHAKKMLKQGMCVSDVSYSVGISDPNYFSKCFRKEVGVSPSEYIKTLNQQNVGQM